MAVVSAYLFREWVVQNTPGDANQESEVDQDDRYFTMTNVVDHGTHINNDNPANGLLRPRNNKTNNDSSGDLYADGNGGITIRNKLGKSQHEVQQETQQCQMQQKKIASMGYHGLGIDEDDEAEIESLMQSIMVQDPADALKRYSWNDLHNSNRGSQQSSKPSPPTTPASEAVAPLTEQPTLDQDILVTNRRSSRVTTTLEDGLDRMESPLFSRGQCDLTTTMWTDLYKRQSTDNWFPTTGFHQTANTQTTTPPNIRRHDNICTDSDDDSVLDDLEPTTTPISLASSASQLYSQPTAGSTHTSALDHETQLPSPSRQLHYANLDKDEIESVIPLDDQQQQQQQDHDIDDVNDDPPLELFDMNDGHFEDEEDAFDLGGDIVGLLETIGMRGNPWVLLQNSILACILLTLFLAVVVWIPYTVGCLITLVRK